MFRVKEFKEFREFKVFSSLYNKIYPKLPKLIRLPYHKKRCYPEIRDSIFRMLYRA